MKETPLQACTRLVAALEKLVDREAASLAMADYAAVKEIQAHAAPMVDVLAHHGPRLSDEKLRARVAKLLARRQEGLARLDQEIARTRQRLEQLQTSQRRAAQIAPVYGGRASGSRRFSAVG